MSRNGAYPKNRICLITDRTLKQTNFHSKAELSFCWAKIRIKVKEHFFLTIWTKDIVKPK